MPLSYPGFPRRGIPTTKVRLPRARETRPFFMTPLGFRILIYGFLLIVGPLSIFAILNPPSSRAKQIGGGDSRPAEQRVRVAVDLSARVVTEGLATWSGSGDEQKSLIVCGRSHLLEDVRAMEDLERVRLLFEDLDTKKDLIQLLGLAERAEGVRIFIGSENKLFSLSGSALIVSPFEDTEQKIVGVLGVIGPTRLNYARIIPMVDYTARLLGRLVP